MKKILLLDSDKKFVKSLEILLNDRYQLISTYHPNLALPIIKKQKIDLLLTDVDFRNVPVLPFFKQVRAVQPDVFIVLMYTVFGQHEDTEVEIKQFVDDVLYKPFDPDVLFDILEKRLNNQLIYRDSANEKDRT